MTTPIGSTRSSSVPADGVAASSRLWIVWALVYALALTLSITSQSLWTDEGFSAWMAAHRTFFGLLHSLRTGDSSDLQMGLYYIWLFFWTRWFGHGEYALRAANIPFMPIFSAALVWTSWRVFHSRIAWVAPALMPFVWVYAGEARPYMAVLAFSAACIAALLGFLSTGARKFVWLFLTSLLLGALFHMLTLLVVAPALALALPHRKWSAWRAPLATFALPFLSLGAFFLWTFSRHAIAYEYSKPGVKQMASVLYELSGFSGLGPNRKLSLDFSSHAIALALGGVAILAGLAFAFYGGFRGRVVRALAAAILIGCFETAALAIVTGKQPDPRHLSALVPLFLFLLTGLFALRRRAASAAMLLLGAGWLFSDIRAATLPEYSREDYRAAVAAALTLHNRTGADIILATDPMAAAYYGLDLRGEAPCFPLVQDCDAGMEKVIWPRTVPAVVAELWPRDRIVAWLNARTRPVIVIHRLDRVRRNTPWQAVLDACYPRSQGEHPHGFDVMLLHTGG